jgi:hypothetical protein
LNECPLPLFVGLVLSQKVTMADAIRIQAMIGAKLYRERKNALRHLGYSADMFLDMAEDVFGCEANEESKINVAKWNWWRWMIEYYMRQQSETENETQTKRMKYLKAMTRTKIQNWEWLDKTQGKFMLYEGKNEKDKTPNKYLDRLSKDTAYKLIRLLEHKEKSPPMFADLEGNIDPRIPDVVESIPNDDLDHVRICATTCRPTLICIKTGLPWEKCLIKMQGSVKHSMSHLAQFERYVEEKNMLPTPDELQKYINDLHPNEVYERDIKAMLQKVIGMFNNVLLENGISINEYKRRKDESHDKEERRKREEQCSRTCKTCNAHKEPSSS